VAHYDLAPEPWQPQAHGGLYRLADAMAAAGGELYVGGYFARTADGEVRSLNKVAV
jgi:hypothetical protein